MKGTDLWNKYADSNRMDRHTDGFTTDNLTEHDVLPIEMRRRDGGDEELGTVGVRSCISLWHDISTCSTDATRQLDAHTIDRRKGFEWSMGKASSSNFSP